jgi:hypothetical protein
VVLVLSVKSLSIFPFLKKNWTTFCLLPTLGNSACFQIQGYCYIYILLLVFQLSPSFSYVNQQLRLLSEWLSLRTMHIKWPINSLQIFLIKIKLLGQPSKHSFCTIWNTWAYPTQESIYVAPSNMNVWTM